MRVLAAFLALTDLITTDACQLSGAVNSVEQNEKMAVTRYSHVVL